MDVVVTWSPSLSRAQSYVDLPRWLNDIWFFCAVTNLMFFREDLLSGSVPLPDNAGRLRKLATNFSVRRRRIIGKYTNTTRKMRHVTGGADPRRAIKTTDTEWRVCIGVNKEENIR